MFQRCFQSDRPHSSATTGRLLVWTAARATAVGALSPLELTYTTLQAGAPGDGVAVASVLPGLRRENDIGVRWRGLNATLLWDAPFSATDWSFYEVLEHPTRLPLPQRAFASGNELQLYVLSGNRAGSLAAFCTVSVDVIKTRRQAPTSIGISSTLGGSVPPSFKMVREIISTDGLRGHFSVAGPHIARVAPMCAIMLGLLSCYRQLRFLLRPLKLLLKFPVLSSREC